MTSNNFSLSFIKIFISIVVLFVASAGLAQDQDFAVSSIPKHLRTEANAVMRKEVVTIDIKHSKRMDIRHEQIITVFNENGNTHLGAIEFYDNTRKIRSQEATLYDANGNEIDRFRRSDFVDRSAISSNDLYTDNRIKYLNFTPKVYPYTLHYISEVETSETAFVMPWTPLRGYYLSIQESSYLIRNESDIPMRVQRTNLDAFDVTENQSGQELTFELKEAPALAREARAPKMNHFTPRVEIALNEFSLVNVEGSANNWQSFGKWQYDNLVHGLDELPESTVSEINALVSDTDDRVEKVKRIYQYMQDKTRYISVQLGIGGWRPYPAEEVDRLGYGDCKGLTNYTKALLQSQGIESYYTVVYAGEEPRDIDADFASMQGNHVILNVPGDEQDIWLECTNQEIPFNYLGNFTDNRNVLVLTPKGGTIKRTARYDEGLQRQGTADITIDASGNLRGVLEVHHTGISYDNVSRLEQFDQKELQAHYSNAFSDIKKPRFERIDFNNDKDRIVFDESLSVSAESYARIIHDKLILQPNAFRASSYVPKKYKNRRLDFEVHRDFSEKDEYQIRIPEGYEIDFVPEEMSLDTPFGTYQTRVTTNDDGSLTFYRTLTLKKGTYPAADYPKYRNFRKDIKKFDHQKIVLKKKSI